MEDSKLTDVTCRRCAAAHELLCLRAARLLAVPFDVSGSVERAREIAEK